MFSHPIGGAAPGGSAAVTFATGDQGPTVPADAVVEWDFDGDGTFDTGDDVTAYVMDAETLTGRDYPSHLTGKAGPGQLKLTLLNDDDRFSYFNSASPLNTPPNSLDTGRKIRIRVRADRALELPGSGGAHASTPDVAALDLTSDQWLAGEFVPDTLAVIQTVAAKFDSTGNNRSIMLQIDASGRPRLIWSTDGTLALQVIATCPNPISGTRRRAVWGALDVNFGGVWLAAFFMADSLDDAADAQVLGTVVGGAPTSVFASAAALRIGAHGTGSSEPFDGHVYRAVYGSGDFTTTGVAVARPDFAAQAPGTTTFVDGPGRTWTLAGTATIVNDPVENLRDPILLARDRFAGPTGPLTIDEFGTPWTPRTAPLRTFGIGRDSTGATMAEPDLKGDSATASIHIVTMDVAADFYAQIRWRFLDPENDLGIVYRFADTNNYGVALVSSLVASGAGAVSLAFVSGGAFSTTAFTNDVELRPDDYLGLFVQGTVATLLHNGVPIVEGTAFGAGGPPVSRHVGLYADWNMHRPPACQEFYVWDGAPDPIPGVLWTGDVTGVMPASPVGGRKTVEVTAEGRLARAAAVDITPPNSYGPTEPNTPGNNNNGNGASTGRMIGATLGRVGLIHPPGFLDDGDVRVGGTELAPAKAIEPLRAYEEAEFGFVHESPEGHVDFDARSVRASTPGSGVWGDDPVTSQFQFSAIELLDWRREIVNRVESGLGPKLPRIIGFQGENTAVGDVIIPMPTTLNGAEPGDLFLIIIASSIPGAQTWITPEGWSEYRDAKGAVGRLRIYAKSVEDDDIGDVLTFLDTAASGDFTSYNLLVKNFYGDLAQGFVISDVHGFGGSSVARARAGQNRPQAVFPPWAPAPMAVISVRAGMVGGAIDNDQSVDEFYGPNGFLHVASAASATLDTGLQMAFRNTNEFVIQPSPWTNDPAGAGFQLYDNVETVTIAIRGFAGDPPETHGGQTIVSEDVASQTLHGGLIRTHVNPARMFATVADAEAYNAAVLAQFANDRPLFRIEFPATKSRLYREQAYARRVGDRIRLVATDESGMGVDADFFVESIGHRIDQGGRRWNVSWELSPA
jgi:hypothetical protein